jgi:hypothetical protein
MKITRNLFLSAMLMFAGIGAVLGLAVHDGVSAAPESSVSESGSSFYFGRRLKDYGVHVPGLASIATTSTTDSYFQVPKAGRVLSIKFSSLAALAASDSNYITWSVTNLGQAGAGSTALLKTDDLNTTKATGGAAIVATSNKSLVLHGTASNLDVAEGDVIRIRATATGTLAGAVTVPSYNILISANGQ